MTTTTRPKVKRMREDTLITLFESLPYPIHISVNDGTYHWRFTYTRRQSTRTMKGSADTLDIAISQALSAFMHIVQGSHSYFDKFYNRYLDLLTRRQTERIEA